MVFTYEQLLLVIKAIKKNQSDVTKYKIKYDVNFT